MLRCLLQRSLSYITGERAYRSPPPYRLDRDIGVITADIREAAGSRHPFYDGFQSFRKLKLLFQVIPPFNIYES